MILPGKSWFIAVGVAFAFGSVVGWYQKSLRVPALLEAQRVADVKTCKEAQSITKETNDELVIARNRIAADLERHKRMQRNTCVHFTVNGKLQSGEGQHAGVHGVNTDTLRDYAALCETYRSELIVCSGQ